MSTTLVPWCKAGASWQREGSTRRKLRGICVDPRAGKAACLLYQPNNQLLFIRSTFSCSSPAKQISLSHFTEKEIKAQRELTCLRHISCSEFKAGLKSRLGGWTAGAHPSHFLLCQSFLITIKVFTHHPGKLPEQKESH